MKYFGGCDVGSTYTKAVILDENGKMCADTTIRSKINAGSRDRGDAGSLRQGRPEGLQSGLPHRQAPATAATRSPFADENISGDSCHAMGVHVTNPEVRAIIDIGIRTLRESASTPTARSKSFAMNDKCLRRYRPLLRGHGPLFEMSLPSSRTCPDGEERHRSRPSAPFSRSPKSSPSWAKASRPTRSLPASRWPLQALLRHGQEGRRHRQHHADGRLREERRPGRPSSTC